MYLTESSRCDEDLVNGDGWYHGDAGTGNAPPEDVGPRWIDVAVVFERLVVPQPIADDALFICRRRKRRKRRLRRS